jgi:hypothetical protein
MLKTNAISPVVRAVLVIGAVAALVTGVTFAALESEATLTQNTIAGADALKVNNDPANEVFNQSEQGFDFANVVPGIASSQTENFELQNTSTTVVNVNVQIPTPPALPTGVTGDDITFTFDTVPGATPVEATWTELTTGDGVLLFTGLAGTTTQEFTVKVDVAGSVTTDTVSVPAFTLLFGVPVVTTP